LYLEADTLTAIDSLGSGVTGARKPSCTADDPPPPDDEGKPLGGSARVLLTLEGSLDSLGLDARASVDRLAWRDWRVPSGVARFAYSPGPRPVFTLDATADSLAHGGVGFSGAAATVRGTLDSLTWFARSRIGDGAAILAGGRYAAKDEGRGGLPDSANARLVAGDSLAIQLPGDVWLLQQPAELRVTDSTATVSRLALQSVYGSGKLSLEGDLPTRGRANAHLQLEAFPLAVLYALLERDTTGVAGTVTLTAGLTGTRASPISSGSFSLTNGS